MNNVLDVCLGVIASNATFNTLKLSENPIAAFSPLVTAVPNLLFDAKLQAIATINSNEDNDINIVVEGSNVDNDNENNNENKNAILEL